MIKKLDAVDVAREGLKMDREILINEFLDRCEHVLSPPPGTCEECGADIDPPLNYDRDTVRTALDRLFSDLRDFGGMIWVRGEAGGVLSSSENLCDRIRRAQDTVRAAMEKDGK